MVTELELITGEMGMAQRLSGSSRRQQMVFIGGEWQDERADDGAKKDNSSYDSSSSM